MAKRLVDGALAGLAGGAAFGMLMGTMGMLPMIAKMVGSESALVGFALHMFLSAAIGAGFGMISGTASACAGTSLAFGLLYGFAWWILGPLTLMPIFLGMGPQWSLAAVKMALPSLGGHLLYGVLTGLAYSLLTHRSGACSTPAASLHN